MKKTVLLFIFLCAATFSFAQRNDILRKYKLENYTPPKYVIQGLDFKFDMLGTYNGPNSSDETHNRESRSISKQNQINASGINLNASANYFRHSNTEKYQGLLSADFVGSYNNAYEKGSGKYEYSYQAPHENWSSDLKNNAEMKLSFNNENRFYTGNRFFIEVNPNVGASFGGFGHNSVSNDNTINDNGYNINTSISLPVAIGWGRIDEVSDARLAVYILDDLVHNGTLDRKVTSADITALAKQITKIKNKRSFDARRHKIAEITTVDSTLRARGLITDDNAKVAYYTSLHDNWDYSQAFSRLSGWRFYVGVAPRILYGLQENNVVNSYSSGSFPQTITNKDFSDDEWMYIGFRHERPINLHWQSFGNIEIAGGFAHAKYRVDSLVNNVQSNGETNMAATEIFAKLYYGVGYYPSSRTYFNAGLQSSFSSSPDMQYKYANSDDTVRSLLLFNTGLSFNAYYYISSQVRLTANYSFGSSYSSLKYKEFIPQTGWADRSTSNRWDYTHNFSVSLYYSLF